MQNNGSQATAVEYLRARHLGPGGTCDHQLEQRTITAQRAACEQAAKKLNAQAIREYVEYGGTGSVDKRPELRLMLDERHRCIGG